MLGQSNSANTSPTKTAIVLDITTPSCIDVAVNLVHMRAKIRNARAVAALLARLVLMISACPHMPPGELLHRACES
jgi:hypothetical protein